MILIFWTAASREEAETITRDLLEEKLIACGSIFPEVLSLYLWKGAIQEETEVKVFLKTKREYVSVITEKIQEKSAYEVPEITAVSPEFVSPPYQKWLDESL